MTYLMNQISQLIQISGKSAESEPYYEVLQSINLTGKNFFRLDYIPTKTDRIEIGAYLTTIGTSGSTYFCTGNDVDGLLNRCQMYQGAGTSGVYVRAFNNAANANIYNYNTIPTSLTDFVIDFKNKKFYVNGTDTNLTITSGNTVCQYPIYLGAVNKANNVPTSASTVVFNYFRAFDTNNKLIVDYIPVLDSQMRPCLYDRVSKTFVQHSNIEGETEAPAYTRWNKFDVDYIENPSTAYIPFEDITPTTTMGMNIEYAYTTLSSSEPAGVIGTYNGDTQRKDTFFVSTSSGYTQKASGSTCGVMVFHRGGNIGTSSSSSTTYIEPEQDVWYSATVNWLADGKINWTDGTTDLEANVGANAVKTNQLRLFSRCNSSNDTYNNCKSRVRKLQFSEGSDIIRDYQPVVWHNGNTTAIATLYDKVYNKMMTPTGSLKAYIISKDGTTTYEVGSNCFATPTTASQQVTNNYFNSGLYGNESWNVRLISFTSTNVAGQLFGNFISSSATNNLTINSGTATGTGTISRFDGQAMSQDKIINMGADTKALLQMNKIGAWKDSTQIVAWSNPNDFTTTGTCYICGTNGSATVRPNGCCYLLIEENFVPIAEYIPVRNATVTSEYGLYDRVSGTLNTGIGTITFNAL